ncbi:sporulation protein YjcZ [Paenibacillus sambharensis]|uniref:Sporulation protein YjcZ n=2 Tax=Paenibacillus sambharensis TaxID=1803190 RepID=A0A2W1L9Y1_9BACL|nr:sporulation protein YjcZ [Paenibacillus sambharensis]
MKKAGTKAFGLGYPGYGFGGYGYPGYGFGAGLGFAIPLFLLAALFAAPFF